MGQISWGLGLALFWREYIVELTVVNSSITRIRFAVLDIVQFLKSPFRAPYLGLNALGFNLYMARAEESVQGLDYVGHSCTGVVSSNSLMILNDHPNSIRNSSCPCVLL